MYEAKLSPNTVASYIGLVQLVLGTGLVAAHKDQNDINASRAGTTYTYDLLGRMTQKNLPTGGQVTTSYNDVPPISSTSTTKITATLNMMNTAERDGLGRVIQTQLNSDPEGTTYVDTTYDLLGRVSTVSNPHRSASLSTDGITTYFYDVLNRSCLVVPSDGTLPTGASCPTARPTDDIFTTYSGNTTTVTDQAGKTRKSTTDALGRLTNVLEDPSVLAYQTVYTYDGLSNLISVVQNGSRQRSFVYNSLSQLTSATNPESGNIAYTYDNDGNVLTKVAPAPNQTGTTTVTTTYAYDHLNRLTGKTYSNSDPAVSYAYDQSNCLGLSACDNIGHRTSMTDAAGSENWSFSVPFSTEIDKRITSGIPEVVTYVNNLDGSQATVTYPSTRVVTYTPGGAGRALAVKGTTNNYATGALYAPAGMPSSFTNGASLVSTFYYDKRLQPCRISAKSSGTAPGSCADTTNIGNVLDFSYNFSLGTADNGNVTGITNNRFPNRSQSFFYDTLNRIVTAQTTATHATDPTDCWGEAYLYDGMTTAGGAWGNLTSIGMASSAYAGCTQEMLSVSATAQNQLAAPYTYDSAGNMTAIPAPIAATYVYNAEGELTSSNAGVSYLYDGDGKRVSKSNGKLYWYGNGSDPIAETAASGSTTDEYIFFGGKRLARIDASGNVVYYVADHLGTSRMVTSSTGGILDQSDFYPFGGERVITASSGNTYKFTGKERDSESGLDMFGARYGSSLGRFMTPDWAAKEDPVPYAHLDDPQSLNLYSYVLNNPLLKPDLDGHGCPPDCSTGNPVADFLGGAANAFGSDNVLGAGRMNQTTGAGQLGQAFGDAGAAIVGAGEFVLGTGGNVGGLALDATGVGAVVGVPANIVSTAAMVQGGAAAGEGFTHLLASAIGPKAGESGGPGSGKAIGDSTKGAALDENKTANGGQTKCVFCGEPVGEGTGNKINYDHAQAKANGGNNSLNNTNVACEYCNKSKGTGTAPKNPKQPNQN